MAAVDPRPEDRLVFLGDYVDRGNASAETVTLLCELRRALPATVFLRGNHEEMLLDFIGLDGANKEAFFSNGGAQTLASYGLSNVDQPPAAEVARALVPPAHLEFFAQMVLQHAAEGFAFVHAGVRPGVPLAEQRREDLLWIREEFLMVDHRLDETIVFGHTPYREVWFGGARKIGLDTGCVYGGRLSCLDLTQAVLHQVARGARSATQRSVVADLDRIR
jgi:serine/threonine protein phosphatase 1